jgi:ABC-type phosphate transport system substrate-binding protein
MKYMKYTLALALAMFATVSHANAQASIQLLGGGSSALFVELGQAAINGAGAGACSWTQGKTSSILARDARTSPATDEQGAIWVVWTPGTGTCSAPAGTYNIWSYMNLDSTIGNRCYFEVDSSGVPGCVQVMTIAANTAGANSLCYPSVSTCTSFGDTTGGIAANVISALNTQHFFVGGTDIRPEDAKYATYRLLQPCGANLARQPFDQILRATYGLGYGTSTTGVGTNIQSFYTTAQFHVLDFNITGNDPINTTAAVPTYTVTTVGAQPIIVAVGPNSSSGTGVNLATDIPMYQLANFYNGALGRSNDFVGSTNNLAVTTLVREPLSGTYNVFEYSAINNSQFHNSQDDFNCNANTGAIVSNPMNLTSLNGNPANAAPQYAFRRRVIGTGEMTAQLQAATDLDNRLGYFFWSAGNAAGKTNVKYLTVNGVDPLLNSYSNGTLPGSGGPADPGLSAVTFKALNNGDYPIWSALRLISRGATTTAVNNLVSALQSLNTTQHDMVTLANLNVWHSHYALPAIGINNNVVANGTTINPATPGDLCNSTGALPEAGGDAGGATLLKLSNHNFCADFAVTTGFVNKTN